MIAYRGALHDTHWYAVVRTALRAHGFAMSAADTGRPRANNGGWAVGCGIERCPNVSMGWSPLPTTSRSPHRIRRCGIRSR